MCVQHTKMAVVRLYLPLNWTLLLWVWRSFSWKWHWIAYDRTLKPPHQNTFLQMDQNKIFHIPWNFVSLPVSSNLSVYTRRCCASWVSMFFSDSDKCSSRESRYWSRTIRTFIEAVKSDSDKSKLSSNLLLNDARLESPTENWQNWKWRRLSTMALSGNQNKESTHLIGTFRVRFWSLADFFLQAVFGFFYQAGGIGALSLVVWGHVDGIGSSQSWRTAI